MRTFLICDQFIARRKRLPLFAFGTFVVLFVASKFNSAGFDLSVTAFPLLIILVFIVTAAYHRWLARTRRMPHVWHQMRLHLNHQNLIREADSVRQEIPWENMTQIHIKVNRQNDPQSILVFSTVCRPVLLIGYESMREIVDLIRSFASQSTRLIIRRQWLDWNHPVVIVAIMVMLFAYFLAADAFFPNSRISTIVLVIPTIGFSIHSLWHGPMSRLDPNMRQMEITSGLVFLVLGLGLLVLSVSK